jgi:thiol-disulfide isomerase/thioredoxin
MTVGALLLLPVLARAQGQDLKLSEEGRVSVEAKLTGDDPANQGKYFKLYKVRLQKDKTYQIDLMSKDFDAYLLLKSGDGTMLAEDDDGGGGLNSRIVFTPRETAEYHVVATTEPRQATGEFTLVVGVKGAVAGASELKLQDGKAVVQSNLGAGDPMEQGKQVKPFTCRFEQGKTYQIDLASTDFDSYLYLFGPDGTKLGEDDDGGGELNSRLVWTAAVTGKYRILATSLNGQDTGNFTLSVAETVTPKAQPVKVTTLKLSAGKATEEGRLTEESPRFLKKPAQHYEIALEGGKTYQIDLASTDFDAFLYLQDKLGRPLSQDDDSGGNTNARIVYAVKDSGTYRILAASFNNGGVGAYTLTITESDARNKATLLKATDVKLDGGKLTVEGELAGTDARFQNKSAKAYSVKLEGGKSYRIDLASNDFDAYLYLQDDNGNLLAQDDDSGGNNDARIIHEPRETGTFRIVACSLDGNGTGKFTLSINEATKEEREQALLEGKVRVIANSPPARQEMLVRELHASFQARKDSLTLKDLQLAMMASRSLEFSNPDLAIEAYSSLGKLLAASSQPRLEEFGRRMEGAGRRLTLRGKEMPLKGITSDGASFDLSKLRGKVVLVDFWATWCGPCVGEIPNMKTAYEKYHERGFEIIGISLDQERAALTSFLEKRGIPWKSIYDRDAPKGKGLSDHYGVMAIPLAILVDREGRVVSMNARGPELSRLLQEQFADKK